jgi:hypothetical protein
MYGYCLRPDLRSAMRKPAPMTPTFMPVAVGAAASVTTDTDPLESTGMSPLCASGTIRSA